MSKIEVEHVALCDGSSIRPPARKPRAPKPRRGERFLKGPVPWDWLCEAAKLPGKALHVAVVLWHVSGLTRSRDVRLEQRHLKSFGLGRKAVYAGLKAMQNLGLVGLKKKTGSRPTVTILDGTDGGSSSFQ